MCGSGIQDPVEAWGSAPKAAGHRISEAPCKLFDQWLQTVAKPKSQFLL